MPSSSKSPANHRISCVNVSFGKGGNQGGRSQRWQGQFLFRGFHPEDHLAAYLLLGHLQEHLGFKYSFFFSDFSPLPLAFPLCRDICLALSGQPDIVRKRKAKTKVAASRPQGRHPSRASTCNTLLQTFSSFQLFSVVCLASSLQGISLFNTCLLRYETRRLKWRHDLLSIHI